MSTNNSISKAANYIFITYLVSFFKDGVDEVEAEYVTECQSFRCPNNAATPIQANTPCCKKTNGFFCACKHIYIYIYSNFFLQYIQY